MKKSAIYPGSFDPITQGHIDIAKRCLKIFDNLIIAPGKNDEKKPLFSIEERVDQIQKSFTQYSERVCVVSFEGLLVNFAKEQNVFTIVRGLRAVSDFEYEFQLSTMNKKLDHRMETVFMMTSDKFNYLSSSLVKEIASQGGDVSCFVPPHVLKELKKRLKK